MIEIIKYYDEIINGINDWENDYKLTFYNQLCTLLKNFDIIKDFFTCNNMINRTILQQLNSNIYNDIVHSYNNCFGNPSYASKIFGDRDGKVIACVYTIALSAIQDAFENNMKIIELKLKFIVEFLKQLRNKENDLLITLYNFKKGMIEIECDEGIKKLACYDKSYINNIFNNYDIMDPDYLYMYGANISNSELQIQSYFSQLGYDTLFDMANTFVRGYMRGYEKKRLDIHNKQYIQLRYPIGFERLVSVIENLFKKQGISICYTPDMPIKMNRQYEYDHRFDISLYLTQEYVELRNNGILKALELYKTDLSKCAGPALIQSFGDKAFVPIVKSEACYLDQNILPLYMNTMSFLGNQIASYMRYNETSFSIISFPVPEIGQQFKEIFDYTIKVNTLPSEEYEKIQQIIINELDNGVYVHIKGAGDNLTDINIQLPGVNDRDSESKFENSGADVNIPVGEVFTSPVLKDTNGIIYISEAFIDGLCYNDLLFEIKDGVTINYSCSNFDCIDENKRYIRENILKNYEKLPIGEFAIGTNTTAYVMSRKFKLQKTLPVLIMEKTGPHFALGDTCYAHREDVEIFNVDGKRVIAKDNEHSRIRFLDSEKAYFNCHTDITIPYNDLSEIAVYDEMGNKTVIIQNGYYVLKGTENLNNAFCELV